MTLHFSKTARTAVVLWSLGCCAALDARSASSGPANWTRQVPSNFPPARSAHTLAYDSAHGQIVLFGGGGFSQASPLGPYNDTWVWDGSNWFMKSPQNKPPIRLAHAMAYDGARSQVVLFGGHNGIFGPGTPDIVYSDTWVWDGSNWTQKSPSNSPSPRLAMSMVYDAAHSQVVLFGGQNVLTNETFSETWVWDGVTWTKKSPQKSPSARVSFAMAYDAAHGQVVLFAGASGNQLLNDTWVWDGSNWTQKSPAASPPARLDCAMAYDAAHGQIVLFGGAGSQGGRFNDTWTWDGANWTQQSPQASPSARNGHAVAYDSAHGQVLLNGGVSPTIDSLADTWTWIGAGSPLPVVNAVVSASAYGGFPMASPGSWIEIYGAFLSSTARPWGGADFTGNNAPTSLDGVQVIVGGKNAFVAYISSGQINAQLPSGLAAGSSQLIVNNSNSLSAPVNIAINAAQPGLLAPAAFSSGGHQYAVALLPDFSTFILPQGLIAGVPSRPAQPGETIILFGIGFGAVTPDIPAGQIVTQSNQLAQQVQILFGQASAEVDYAGLAPGFVGLYQFNIVVPAVPDSDLVPLTFKLGGAASTQTLYTAVHQ